MVVMVNDMVDERRWKRVMVRREGGKILLLMKKKNKTPWCDCALCISLGWVRSSTWQPGNLAKV